MVSIEAVTHQKQSNSVRALWLTALIGSFVLGANKGSGATKDVRALVEDYCLDCHDKDSLKGDLNLERLLGDPVVVHTEIWEKVDRKLRTRQMPPAKENHRPAESKYTATQAALEKILDTNAESQPRPGRTETIRRLNRTEYQNAIRDLLDLNVDAKTLLPRDDASHGFDNVTVGTLSPTLLDRYISAAQKISRLAVGGELRVPDADTIRIKPDITQEHHVEDLPFGTRGGAVIPYTFSRDGDYEITIRLTRDRNDEVEGLHEPHELLVLIDREQVGSFEVKPPARGEGYNDVDAHLNLRVPVKAGPHELGVTFLKNPWSLLDYEREPYESHFNFHRHPRIGPAVFQVSIVGPYDSTGPGDSPSRRRVFTARPKSKDDEEPCARKILSALARRAYRRPVTDNDVDRLMPFFRDARKSGGFDEGIESALSAILVSREFLFRVEEDPKDLAAGTVYKMNDLELASRLSFLIWSSIPDDELLDLAERGELGKPEVLEHQTRRMLADSRAESLVTNFAAQWLELRNLNSVTPDGRLFPDFDDNLRQAMRRETELMFGEVLREDRSVLDLLKSDHTYLNERLAKHYGIPHVYGSQFRRVTLGLETHRGGILRDASILALTSYATRTSPVIRGKFLLANLIGTPPPSPPPNVPALDNGVVSETLPIRERLAAHRDKPACASCHRFIDPPGFALENFDALGRWRDREAGQPVDASGGLPDGSQFVGVDGLEQGLLNRPEIFATTMAEKLMTFALGRGIEYYDGAAIRKVVRQAAAKNYRFSELIVGIVQSVPFRMRESL